MRLWRAGIGSFVGFVVGVILGLGVGHPGALGMVGAMLGGILEQLIELVKIPGKSAEDMRKELDALNTCDGCKTVYPNWEYYLVKVEGKGFLCKKCRSELVGTPQPGAGDRAGTERTPAAPSRAAGAEEETS